MSREKRKERERKRRRGEILERAIEVFSQRGITQTTMTDIADSLGYGKASLYYYFDSKEEILIEIFKKAWGMMTEVAEEKMKEDTEPKKKFLEILKSHLKLYLQYPRLYGILFKYYREYLQSFPDNKREELESIKNRYLDVYRTLLRKMQKKDWDSIMKTFGGMVYGLFEMGSLPNRREIENFLKIVDSLL